jgi:hypothetical protein
MERYSRSGIYRTITCFLLIISILAINSGCTGSIKEPGKSQVNNVAESESPSPENTPVQSPDQKQETSPSDIMEKEIRGAFDYFWHETQSEPGSPGYGLTRDSDQGDRDYSSIAATGFALSAYVIGVEKGYITREQGLERTEGTLDTFLNRLDAVDGFFFHFYHLSTGKPYDVEVSTIDTALFLCGAIVAGEYFGGSVREKARMIYDRIDWQAIVKPNQRFYMAYKKNDKGDYVKIGEWDVAAEQLVMYILGAGSATRPIDGQMFYRFNRWKVKYGDYEYIRSWANSLFAYQYSHAYVDFRNTTDEKGVDWFKNSVNATLASRQYAIDHQEDSKTYGENSWGHSACISPEGYNGLYGAEPNGMPGGESLKANDGTIAIYGAVASIVFAPEEAKAAMVNYYDSYPTLWGKYGFKDSYNLDIGTSGYFCPSYLGIDKGISIVQLMNYQNGLIWELFMKNEQVKQGLKACGIKSRYL